MTDDDILRLAAQQAGHPDSREPTLRGRKDVLAFARAVLAADARLRADASLAQLAFVNQQAAAAADYPY